MVDVTSASLEQLIDRDGDVVHVRLEREVSGVEHLHDRLRVVLLEGGRARGNEERVVLPPDGERRIEF